MVVACIALGITLSGVGYAAVVLPKNSVGTAQLKNNAVNSAKVKNRTLLGADFKAGQIPAGPAGPQGPKGDPGLLASLNQTDGLGCTQPSGKSGLATFGIYPEQGAGSGLTSGSGTSQTFLECLAEDMFEQNDADAQAVNINNRKVVTGEYWPIKATIFPAGDDDWYVFNGSLRIIYVFGADEVKMDIYRNGTQIAQGVTQFDVNPDDTVSHLYKVRVTHAARRSYQLYMYCPYVSPAYQCG